MLKILKILNMICSRIILLICIFPTAALICANNTWTNLDFEQILANITGGATYNFLMFSPNFLLYLLASTTIYCIIFIKFSNKKIYILSAIIFIIFIWQSKMVSYYYNRQIITDLYEKEYKIPEIKSSDFPQKKRNLLLIYMESIERNFSNSSAYAENLIPNLSDLSKHNPHFDNYYSLYGTHYTKGAFVAGMCGVPNRSRPELFKTIDHEYNNLTCISDILSQNGYETWFTQTVNHDFANTKNFYISHNYQYGINAQDMTHELPSSIIKDHLGSMESLSDKILFKYVIQSFNKRFIREPFLYTIFTIDSHTPPEYTPIPDCKHKYNDIRDNIICTNKNVTEFLEEFKKTPYWENTTIVLLGDHLMVRPPFNLSNKKINRGIYNVFLNLPHKFKYNSEKQFTAVDFAPTYLEAIDINLPEHAFGLGRSLFSDVPTLISHPELNFSQKVQQRSKVYDNFHKIRE